MCFTMEQMLLFGVYKHVGPTRGVLSPFLLFVVYRGLFTFCALQTSDGCLFLFVLGTTGVDDFFCRAPWDFGNGRDDRQ